MHVIALPPRRLRRPPPEPRGLPGRLRPVVPPVRSARARSSRVRSWSSSLSRFSTSDLASLSTLLVVAAIDPLSDEIFVSYASVVEKVNECVCECVCFLTRRDVTVSGELGE